jgi:hypothetical protein
MPRRRRSQFRMLIAVASSDSCPEASLGHMEDVRGLTRQDRRAKRKEFLAGADASRGGVAVEPKSASGMSWILFAKHPGSCSFARLGN